jgi:HlyD family secretion protein
MKAIHKKKVFTCAVIISGVITLFFSLSSCRKNGHTVTFETVKVTRSKISNTVTATGTIQALKTVAVGTQVSGVISKIYADFNSHVNKGQLLAELDRVPLLANLENAQASLDDAQAEVNFQTSNYNRIKSLFENKIVAQSDIDQATYTYSKALAGYKTAKANYNKAKINLDYASIHSPIDGVVLNRAVDEGQTVAASFNTPTLFSIANDLTQMQVEANIDEADIGQIKEGQKVEFTVDAFPDLNFSGQVTQIRLQPVSTSNVITYTVIVKAENPDKKLMPGMTANITVIVEKNDSALIIPSKALRFKPDSLELKAYFETLPPDKRPNPEERKTHRDSRKPDEAFQNISRVWIKNGELIHPVKIKVGINDGSNTEVINGLNEGDEVILTMNSANNSIKNTKAATTNPFMPKPPSRRK